MAYSVVAELVSPLVMLIARPFHMSLERLEFLRPLARLPGNGLRQC